MYIYNAYTEIVSTQFTIREHLSCTKTHAHYRASIFYPQTENMIKITFS